MAEGLFNIVKTDDYKSSMKDLKKEKHVDSKSIKDAEQRVKWALERKPEEYRAINEKVRLIVVDAHTGKGQTLVFDVLYQVCEKDVCLRRIWASLPEWRM